MPYLKELSDRFKNYRLSNYLYAFGSFFEVLLLGNYNAEYLNSVADEVRAYALKYRELYSKVYEIAEAYAGRSVEKLVGSGAAAINKKLGADIAKVPVIRKTQIDENLQKIGEKIDTVNTGSKENILEEFRTFSSCSSEMYADKISLLRKWTNELYEIYIKGDQVYMPVA